MSRLEQTERRILVPFDRREGISPKQAAEIAGKTERTVRNWCEIYGLGRRVGGGIVVSRIALAMYLDGDHNALASYHDGDRSSHHVKSYFLRVGVPLPKVISA